MSGASRRAGGADRAQRRRRAWLQRARAARRASGGGGREPGNELEVIGRILVGEVPNLDRDLEGVVDEVILLASQLGGDTQHNRRKAHQRYKAIVSEVYSPPRVAIKAREMGLSLTCCDILHYQETSETMPFQLSRELQPRLECQDLPEHTEDDSDDRQVGLDAAQA